MVCALLVLVSGTANAEDIEVYFGSAVSSYISNGSGSASTGLPESGPIKSVLHARYLAEENKDSTLINRNSVSYEHYTASGHWGRLPNFDRYPAISTGTLASFSDYPRTRTDFYSFKYTAVLNVPAAGTYRFYTTTDDGSKLFIDGTQVVSNDGIHGATERSGSIYLTAGPHNVIVTYYDYNSADELFVQWSGNSIARQPLEPWLTALPNYNAVSYELYHGNWRVLPNFDALTPVSTGKINNFSLGPKFQGERYGFRYKATLRVPASDSYRFTIGSDDGSQLFINGTLVVNNDGLHGYRERSGSRYLAAGDHEITVTFFERTGGDNLTVRWSSSTIPKQDLATWLVGEAHISTPPVQAFIRSKTYPADGYLSDENSNASVASSNVGRADIDGASQWELYHAGTSADGNDVVIVIASDTDRLLDGGWDNAVSDQSGWTDTHKWELLKQADDSFRFRNVSTGRYLYATAAGDARITTNLSDAVEWWLLPAAPNVVTAADSQDWKFEKQSVSSDGNDIVQISHTVSSNFLASMQGGVAATNVYAGSAGSDKQNWEMIPLGGDRYHIRNTADSRYLRANGSPDLFNVDAFSESSLPSSYEWIILPPSDSGTDLANIVKPNVLFILDASGSMNWTDSGESGTRLQRMKSALKTVLGTMQDVNVGLMRFSHSYSGGRILHPVAPIETVRDDLIEIVDSIIASHGTPTVGALYEAARYFRGEAVEYGRSRGSSQWMSGITYSRVSAPESFTGGSIVRTGGCTVDDPNNRDCATEYISGSPVYISPIVSECQSNHIVVLTDGTPTSDAIATAGKLVPGTCKTASARDGTCGEELAEFLATTDQSSAVSESNVVVTHTIGFNFANEWLKSVAEAGTGNFYTAESAAELQTAIASLLLTTEAHENTMIAPGVTLDQATQVSHRSDVYFTLFEPAYNTAWRGNLKRYHFDGAIRDSSVPPKVAIDADTGSFHTDAKSFWSADSDGSDVGAGGAASQLDATDRHVTTYLAGNVDELKNPNNAVNRNNISASHLGLPDSSLQLTVADKDKILDWADGVDVLDYDGDGSVTDTRHFIGDPLHSSPAIVTYDWSGTEPDSVVFFGTNEGYLHAINTADGKEVFSYIPHSLLPVLKHRYANLTGVSKTYGVDGPITLWVEDTRSDKKIGSTGEHAYLYAGLRRGGREYFSLDVTEKENPKFRWSIQGGSGDFKELGQTWSRPTLSTVKLPGDTHSTQVLIFGGGYDPLQDNAASSTADTMGRAVYMVDADTGDLLWSAGQDSNADLVLPDMLNSLPADPRVVDMDGDGYDDNIYIGDMGGRVWRFDIDNHAANTRDFVKGGAIAHIAGTTQQDARRFFNTPDVALVMVDGEPTRMISMGSGYRAHPLNRIIEDRFYVLREARKPIGFGVQESGVSRPVTEADLFDVTDNVLGQGNASEKLIAEEALADAKGWYLQLEAQGEKSLSSSTTINNQVIFTSYKPSSAAGGCGAELGSGALYVLSVIDGTPTVELPDEDDTHDVKLTKEDRMRDLERPGIPPAPRIMFPEQADPILIVGPESGPVIDSGPLMKRMWWTESPDF